MDCGFLFLSERNIMPFECAGKKIKNVFYQFLRCFLKSNICIFEFATLHTKYVALYFFYVILNLKCYE